MTQINAYGNLDCIPSEEEYLLSEVIEDYYAGRFAKHYAHTDATGTTVLCGRVDLVEEQRRIDAEVPLWMQVCDNAVAKQGLR